MDIDSRALLEASDAFFSRIEPPTTNNLIQSLLSRSSNPPETLSQITTFARQTRILLHPRLVPLVDAFLSYKRLHVTEKERSLYSNLTREDFIKRLIKNRPLVFFTHFDRTLLRDGSTPPAADWLRVGHDTEGKIKIEDYLTYDEMQIAALLGVSSPTYFINDGDRDNAGRKGKPGSYEEEGVYVGLVGARFEKSDQMDTLHILVSEKHSTPKNGYGAEGKNANPKAYDALKPFANLYLGQDHFPTYADATSDPESSDYEYLRSHSPFSPKNLFNIKAYKSRIRIPLELLLLDANDRAKSKGDGTKAFVHVVGLGLGVWRKSAKQYKYYVEALGDVLRELELPFISDIELAYFPDDSPPCAGAGHNQKITNAPSMNDITIHFTMRNPATKLPLRDGERKLLVASYAWDGNSYPGNEYWMGMVAASGDPAAVCCSLIGELQNAEINEGFLERIWCAE
ncbi:hypothetical protein HDV00_011953 [Rhizophlyctis rosea]|nr:hypothetical protein HDV00_011953 [Rhizophlyctis rosea]